MENLTLKREVRQLLLDSSFLFIPPNFEIDIFRELTQLLNGRFELIVLSATVKELQKLSRNKSTKLRKQAGIALKFAEQCRVYDANEEEHESHDDVIVRIAKTIGCIVATNDKTLRKRLRNLKVPVIYLRQKTKLDAIGALEYTR
jgi:rRNA-processing protein FCF1